MDSKPVRLGIVGAGHRGAAYLQHIVKIPEARLTAVCDQLPQRMDLLEKRFGVEGLFKTTNLAELLAGDRVEAVIVTVPDFAHREVAVAAFEAGKDVLLEKPLAPTADECRKIVRAQKASGRLLQVGFPMRCIRFYQRIKEIVDSGRLGQIMFVRACEYLSVDHIASFQTRWHRKKANSGSFLLSKCSHDLDMLNWIIGSKPTHVASFGGIDFFVPSRAGARTCSQCPRADKCPYKANADWYHVLGETPAPGSDRCAFNDDKDLVDNQVVILQYANNVRATFELQAFYPKVSSRFITIGAENGYLEGDLESFRLVFRSNATPAAGAASGAGVANAAGLANEAEEIDVRPLDDSGHGGGDFTLAKTFVESIRSRQAPLAGAIDGLACNVIADAVEKARMEMRVVAIDPAEYGQG